MRALRGFSLGDGDYALEVLTLGLKCGDAVDEPCQLKIGNQIHADRFVWGTVKRSKSTRQVVAELHLWTRGRPPTKTEVTFSDNLTAPGDDGLRRLVDDALAVLLERKAASNAPARPATPAAATATPTAADPVDEGAGVASRSDTTSSNLHTTLGWTGIGVGTALLAGGIYSVVRVNSIESDEKVERYRQGFRPDVDSCERADAGESSRVPGSATPGEMQDFCSSAGTFQALQFVFFGLGAISAGAGLYMLASDNPTTASAPKTRFAVAPPMGRSPARFEFTLQF